MAAGSLKCVKTEVKQSLNSEELYGFLRLKNDFMQTNKNCLKKKRGGGGGWCSYSFKGGGWGRGVKYSVFVALQLNIKGKSSFHKEDLRNKPDLSSNQWNITHTVCSPCLAPVHAGIGCRPSQVWMLVCVLLKLKQWYDSGELSHAEPAALKAAQLQSHSYRLINTVGQIRTLSVISRSDGSSVGSWSVKHVRLVLHWRTDHITDLVFFTFSCFCSENCGYLDLCGSETAHEEQFRDKSSFHKEALKK